MLAFDLRLKEERDRLEQSYLGFDWPMITGGFLVIPLLISTIGSDFNDWFVFLYLPALLASFLCLMRVIVGQIKLARVDAQHELSVALFKLHHETGFYSEQALDDAVKINLGKYKPLGDDAFWLSFCLVAIVIGCQQYHLLGASI